MSIRDPKFALGQSERADDEAAFVPESVEGRLADLEARVARLEASDELTIEALRDLGRNWGSR